MDRLHPSNHMFRRIARMAQHGRELPKLDLDSDFFDKETNYKTPSKEWDHETRVLRFNQ